MPVKMLIAGWSNFFENEKMEDHILITALVRGSVFPKELNSLEHPYVSELFHRLKECYVC